MAKARPITGLDLQTPTGKNARVLIQERLADMYACAEYIASPANIQGLHDLRITAKRVRYSLEIFEEYLPEAAKEFVEELAKLQDELGALHDSEVMLALLHLLLQQEQRETVAANQDAAAAKKQPLLSAKMVQSLLSTTRRPALSETERHGLMGFLHRQEQRREQAYVSFRQHWELLEQRHFREELLALLEHDKTARVM